MFFLSSGPGKVVLKWYQLFTFMQLGGGVIVTNISELNFVVKMKLMHHFIGLV